MSNQIPHGGQADISRAEIIRTVASALAEWEDETSGELYTAFAARIVAFVLCPRKGMRKPDHEDGQFPSQAQG